MHQQNEQHQQELLGQFADLKQSRQPQPKLRHPFIGPLDLSREIFGRESEANGLLGDLTNWNGRRIIPILGPPGFGKSGILTRTVQKVVPQGKIADDRIGAILAIDCRDKDDDPIQALARTIQDACTEDVGKEVESFFAPGVAASTRVRAILRILDEVSGEQKFCWVFLQNAEALLDEVHHFRSEELDLLLCKLLVSSHVSVRFMIESRLRPLMRNCSEVLDSGAVKPLSTGLRVDDAFAWLRAQRDYCTALQEASDERLHALIQRVHGIPGALEMVVIHLKSAGELTTLVELLGNQELFAHFDANDDVLREKGFRALVKHHFESLSQDTRIVLGFASAFPFPVPMEALQVCELEGALSPILTAQAHCGMLTRTRDRLGTQRFALNPAVQEVIVGLSKPLGEREAESLHAEGILSEKGKKHRISLDLFHGASAILERLVAGGRSELENDLASAVMNRGVSLDSLGRLTEAVADYARAIEILERLVAGGRSEFENHLAGAVMNRGNSLDSMGRLTEAVADYDRAIEILERLIAGGRSELEKDVASAVMNRGVSFRSLGRLTAAVADYDRAIEIRERLVAGGLSELEKDVARAVVNRGNSLHSLGRLTEAVANYDRAIEILERRLAGGRSELENDLAGAVMNRGNSLRSLGRLVEAVADYDRAITIRSRLVAGGWRELLGDLGMAYANRGMAKHAQGDAIRGCEDFGRAQRAFGTSIRDGQEGLHGYLEQMEGLIEHFGCV